MRANGTVDVNLCGLLNENTENGCRSFRHRKGYQGCFCAAARSQRQFGPAMVSRVLLVSRVLHAGNPDPGR